jgi:hypothetical protein
MKQLLNISTHDNDLETIDHDWDKARDFCLRNGFDGYELYPVGDYDWGKIPSEIVVGLHLRFYAILEPMWQGNHERLMEIFDDEETVELFYGGLGRGAIVDAYREQLALAHDLGCEYVVFHASQNELEYVYNWECPWSWQETLDLSAEIMNEATQETPYAGELLFENLWWPGSMRLDGPAEISYLMERVDYPRSGIILDTGHVLNKNQALRSEGQGIDFLVETLRNLGGRRRFIQGVHLTRSISSDYVRDSKGCVCPYAEAETFWDRFFIAHEHVTQIDRHNAFEDPAIVRLFDWVDPRYLVFEFSYCDMVEWQCKIDRQKRALGSLMHG